MEILLVILQLSILASGHVDDDLDRPVPVEEIHALAGSRVELPCDVTPMKKQTIGHRLSVNSDPKPRPWATSHDTEDTDTLLAIDYIDPDYAHRRSVNEEQEAYLVLWFLDPDRKPVYSFDVRGRPVTSGKHWWDEGRLGRRARFILPSNGNVPRLQITNVTSSDGGVYRCRVDYKYAPTKNYIYRLLVMEPPSAVLILDNALQQLSTVAGPIEEGTDLILTCRAIGGFPNPWVSWWHGGQLIDNSTDFRSSDTVSNRLIFQRVSRRHLHDTFTCQVSLSLRLPPIMKTVSLELLLRPLFAEILLPTKPLLANQSLEVRCRTAGSRPAPVVSWWKGNQQIQHKSIVMSSDDGNVTVSILTLLPTYEDDGKLLYCRAENSLMSSSAQEDSIRLDVHYSPIVRLTLGSNINGDDVKEGDDLYLECHIKSNPAYHKLAWTHNGMGISHNATAGVIFSNVSLVLQSVTRQRAGNYTCIVSNSRGETSSSPLLLRVQYAPRCRSDSDVVLGVSKQEAAILNCFVDADPPDVHFWWTFLGTPMKTNNGSSIITSGEAILIPKHQYTSQATSSTLNYVPKSDLEFGVIACWASNAVGNQREPCLFHVVPAGKPRAPLNCTVHNRTADSLRVDCQEAFDGGLEQTFGLEVVDPGTRGIKLSLSNSKPSFILNGLEPETALLLSIYAVNSKGRSEEVGLEAITLRAPEKHTGPSGTFQITPLLAILIGTAATLLVIVLAVAVVVQRRHQLKRQRSQEQQQAAVDTRDECCSVRTSASAHTTSKEGENEKRNPPSDRTSRSIGHFTTAAAPTSSDTFVYQREPDIILRDIADYPSHTVLPAVIPKVSTLPNKPEFQGKYEIPRGQHTIPVSGWCPVPDIHLLNPRSTVAHPWDRTLSHDIVCQDVISNSMLPESSL